MGHAGERGGVSAEEFAVKDRRSTTIGGNISPTMVIMNVSVYFY